MKNATLLIHKIRTFQSKKLTITLWATGINLITCLTCLWFITLVSDQIFYFSHSTRWFILIFNILLTVGIITVLYLPPLLSVLRLHGGTELSSITDEIGNHYPEIRDKLTNIYQLINQKDWGNSSQLKEFAISRFYDQIRNLNFKEHLNFKNHVMPVSVLLPIWAGSIFLLSTFDLPLAAKRIFNPNEDFTKTPAFTFVTNPGHAKIILGQPLDIRVRYQGPPNSGCLLLSRPKEESSYQQTILHMFNGYYQGELPNIRRPLEYRIKAMFAQNTEWSQRIISELYQVQVIIPPLLSDMSITITPPAYTSLPQQYLEENTGDLLVYPGSTITLNASINKQIKEAKIVFADSSVLEARIREDKIQSKFVVNKSGSYHIDLVDQDGVPSQNPIEYAITLLEDQYPAVNLVEPATDVEVPADGAVTLLMEGRDDFGFSDLKLHYQIIGKSELTQDSSWHEQSLPYPRNAGTFFQQNYFWNFAMLDVGFEEAIKYYVRITDNDPIYGPKSSSSQTYFIHFPSLGTLFNTFAEQQSSSQKEAEQVAAESDDLQKKLEAINRELKRDNTVDWQKKKEIESAVQKQNELQDRLDRIQQNLDEAIKKLENAQLLSPEVLEKYNQLQQLFQQIASPEFLQAMEDLQKSLQKLNDSQLQNAMQKMQLNQQQFKERLDRTLELFKKVQLEQAMDQLVQLAKKMVDEQKKISEQLKTEKPLAAENQAELENKTKGQQNLLQQTEQNLEAVRQNELLSDYGEIIKDLQTAQTMIEQQHLSAQLETSKDMIRQNNTRQAGQQSQQIEQGLQQLYNALKQVQQNMLSSEQTKLLSKMQKVSANLLQLSATQEKLMEETKNFTDVSAGFRDMTQQQQTLSENMNGTLKDIIDLSHQTFFISPELSKSLGKASSGIRQTLEELQNRNQALAGKFQEQSMAGLNESVLGMQKSMQQMAQANSALGFEQFMQSLQQMAQQQGILNEESINFLNGMGNQGALTVQQQQELKRLAAAQSALKQAMEQLAGEMNERSDVLGRLDNLLEEMEKVVQDLDKSKLDRTTIERQQQIFNRLLDAQKSVREREYSRERQAETGKTYAYRSPAERTDAVNQRLQKLQRDLQRALQEGFHPAYEKIIEEYFKALNRLESNDKNMK